VAFGVVPELCEHPGTEDDTKSWRGVVDVGVGVLLKRRGQFDLEDSDLVDDLADDPYR
jgi:hypothetical protein